MNELSFFPVLTEELIEDCGCRCDKYTFSFVYQDQKHELVQSGKNTIKLTDPLEIWKIEDEGLSIEKKVEISHPHLLLRLSNQVQHFDKNSQ